MKSFIAQNGTKFLFHKLMLTKKKKKLPDIDKVNFTHRNDEYSNGIATQLMRIAHAQEYSKRTKNIPLMNDDPRT